MDTTHFTDNGRIQTAYNKLSDGSDRPAFVLVHGFTGSKLDFQDQLPWFTDLRQVIAYDQRGHGESSNIGPYHLTQLASDLIGLLNALEIERCDLLGHSMGGMVAMRAALDHPERFSSLILMDTASEPLNLWPEGVRDNLKQLVTTNGCAALLDMTSGIPATAAQQRGIDYLGEDEHISKPFARKPGT